MAISAERFKFLDKETNIPIQEFIKVTSNAVYNTIDNISESEMALLQDAEKELKKLVNDSIPDTFQELANSTTTQAQEQLKTALNDSIDLINSMELPDIVNDILADLKTLDLNGVTEFFRTSLNIGGKFLCDNLNFLKNFSLGFGFNSNIISGLITSLLLNWLDRICKEFSAKEQDILSPEKIIGKMYPFKGTKITTNNVLSEFSKLYGDYLKLNTPSTVVTPPTEPVFLTSVLAGTLNNELAILKSAEITDTQKNSYIAAIETELPNHLPSTPEYSRLLEARGKLLTTKFIDTTRRSKVTKYKNLNSNIGLFAKNIVNVDIQPLKFNAPPLEVSLHTSLTTFKNNASTNSLLKATSNESLNNFDVTTILPTLTAEETTYFSTLNKSSNSHRTFNLHPTTEEFLV